MVSRGLRQLPQSHNDELCLRSSVLTSFGEQFSYTIECERGVKGSMMLLRHQKCFKIRSDMFWFCLVFTPAFENRTTKVIQRLGESAAEAVDSKDLSLPMWTSVYWMGNREKNWQLAAIHGRYHWIGLLAQADVQFCVGSSAFTSCAAEHHQHRGENVFLSCLWCQRSENRAMRFSVFHINSSYLIIIINTWCVGRRPRQNLARL